MNTFKKPTINTSTLKQQQWSQKPKANEHQDLSCKVKKQQCESAKIELDNNKL
jgi:hypothetical protein